MAPRSSPSSWLHPWLPIGCAAIGPSVSWLLAGNRFCFRPRHGRGAALAHPAQPGRQRHLAGLAPGAHADSDTRPSLGHGIAWPSSPRPRRPTGCQAFLLLQAHGVAPAAILLDAASFAEPPAPTPNAQPWLCVPSWCARASPRICSIGIWRGARSSPTAAHALICAPWRPAASSVVTWWRRSDRGPTPHLAVSPTCARAAAGCCSIPGRFAGAAAACGHPRRPLDAATRWAVWRSWHCWRAGG